MSAPVPKLRLRGVRKQFGDKKVLKGIDLDVMPGTSLVVIGGSGSAIMDAGSGSDTIVGGSGWDQFEFHSGGGQNVVMGFHDGDLIQVDRGINGLNINTAADVAAHVQDVHGNAVIQLGSETITLVGIKAEDIHNNPSGFIVVH